MHISPSIFGLLKIVHYTQHPFKNSVDCLILFYSQCWRRIVRHRFVRVFCLVPTQKYYLSLCRALVFCFILVHAQVIRVGNYYIIIFTMKKHHFIWTSILNCGCRTREISMFWPNKTGITTEKLFCSGGAYHLRPGLAPSDQSGSVCGVKLYAPPLLLVDFYEVWKLVEIFPSVPE